jgi:hypothetical protein
LLKLQNNVYHNNNVCTTIFNFHALERVHQVMDMMIDSIYLANWKNLATCRQTQIHYNNVFENKSRISCNYNIDYLIFVRKSAVKQKLTRLQDPFASLRSILISHSATNGKRINIHRLHATSPRSN